MIDRKEASEFLGISIATIIRMEKQGVLSPVKYTGPKSKVYYKKTEVENLTNVTTA